MKQLKLKQVRDNSNQEFAGQVVKMEPQSNITEKQFQFQNAKTAIAQKFLEIKSFYQQSSYDSTLTCKNDKNNQEIIQIVNQTYQFISKINLKQKSNFKNMEDFKWGLLMLQNCQNLVQNVICVSQTYESSLIQKVNIYLEKLQRILQNSTNNLNGYKINDNLNQLINFLYKLARAILKTKSQSASSSFFNKLFNQSFVINFTSEHIFGQISHQLLKPYSFILIKISQNMNYSLINKKIASKIYDALIVVLKTFDNKPVNLQFLLIEECFRIKFQIAPYNVKQKKSDNELIMLKVIQIYKKQSRFTHIFKLLTFLTKMLGSFPSLIIKLIQAQFMQQLLNFERFLSSSSIQYSQTQKVEKFMEKIEDVIILLKSNITDQIQKIKLIEILNNKIVKLFNCLQKEQNWLKSETERCIIFYLLHILNHLLQGFDLGKHSQEAIIKITQNNFFQLLFKILSQKSGKINFFFKKLSQAVSIGLKLMVQLIYKIYQLQGNKSYFIKYLSSSYYQEFATISAKSSSSLLGRYISSANISQIHKKTVMEEVKKIQCTLKMPTIYQIDTTLQ